MKDLLASNIILGEQEGPADRRSVKDELRISIERYRAQGFDVSPLEKLVNSPAEEIPLGIERYRECIRKLISAQTIIRSLEGYGYSDEIERIMQDIKDPQKADSVMTQTEELRDRALTEHNVSTEKKETKRVKLPEALKAQSVKLNNRKGSGSGVGEIDTNSLDEMLANLDEMGEALIGVEEEPDPMMEKIQTWEAEGYFVDGLVALLGEDRDAAVEEMKVFEEGILEIRALRERFNNLDLSSFPEKTENIRIKFSYPHMASEIRNELDNIDRIIEEALREEAAPEEEATGPSEPGLPEGTPPTEVTEAPVPAPEEAEEEAEEAVPAEAKPQGEAEKEAEEGAAAEAGPPEEDIEPGEAPGSEPEVEGAFPELDLDQLTEKAKEMYREGDLENSLKCFEEILRRDPDNSKARFMIRRLSAK